MTYLLLRVVSSNLSLRLRSCQILRVNQTVAEVDVEAMWSDVTCAWLWHLSMLFLISHFHLWFYRNRYYCCNSFHWLVLEYIFSIPLLSFCLGHSVRYCSCKPDVAYITAMLQTQFEKSIIFNRPLESTCNFSNYWSIWIFVFSFSIFNGFLLYFSTFYFLFPLGQQKVLTVPSSNPITGCLQND